MGVSRQPSATDFPSPPFGRALLPAPFLRHYGTLALDQAHENSPTGSSPTSAPSSLRDAHRQTRALPGAELARRVWAATGGSVTQLLTAAKLVENPTAVHAPPSPWILPIPLQHIDSTAGVAPASGNPLVEAILSLAGHLELLSSGVGSPTAVFEAAVRALSAAVANHAAHSRSRAGTNQEGLYRPGSGDSDTARWGVALPAIHIIQALMLHDDRCRAAAVASCAGAPPLVRPALSTSGRREEAVAGGYRAPVERVRVRSSGGSGTCEVAVVGGLLIGTMNAEVSSLALR